MKVIDIKSIKELACDPEHITAHTTYVPQREPSAPVQVETPWKECSDVIANITTDVSRATQSSTAQAALRPLRRSSTHIRTLRIRRPA